MSANELPAIAILQGEDSGCLYTHTLSIIIY